MGFPRRKGPAEPVHAVRRTGRPSPRFNYELFNCNSINIRYWSWNYRGCWPIFGGRPEIGGPSARPESLAPGVRGIETDTFARVTGASGDARRGIDGG